MTAGQSETAIGVHAVGDRIMLDGQSVLIRTVHDDEKYDVAPDADASGWTVQLGEGSAHTVKVVRRSKAKAARRL